VHVEADRDAVRERLGGLERALAERGSELALYLVFDRPQRAKERPGLARTFFVQRCASTGQLTQIINAFREVGAYVELFEGEEPFFKALADGRIQAMRQPLKIVYNEIEGGITAGGFQPGRKALIPAVADAYGLMCSNSNAYGCALGRHKFHYSTLLNTLGVRTPQTWHYRPSRGWAASRRPTTGMKVIVKSTYENWSVGVTDASIFHVDDSCDERVQRIANEIGQPVTVQQFISGTEVGVTVFSCPDLFIAPPVMTVLTKAPADADAVMTVFDNFDPDAVSMEPFDAPASVLEELFESAARAFDTLELGAFARFDFRVDAEERTWLTDVGVSPGISRTSQAFVSLAELGFDHPSFLRAVVATTLAAQGRLGECRASQHHP
jgi:D-alanine-D-alanine ligase